MAGFGVKKKVDGLGADVTGVERLKLVVAELCKVVLESGYSCEIKPT